jgi:hypothetical protein
VEDLDHPPSGLLVRVALLDVGFCATVNDVGDVAVVRDGAKVLGSTVTRVRAQMLVSPMRRILASRTMALSTSSSRLQSWELTPGHDKRHGAPRPSTSLVDGACAAEAPLGQRLPLVARAQHVDDRLEHLSSRLRRPASPWLAQVDLVSRRARGNQRSARCQNSSVATHDSTRFAKISIKRRATCGSDR